VNFRAAVRRYAGPEMDGDDSMDASQMGEDAPSQRSDWQPGIGTDDADPATPGGPAPYNAAPPGHGQPVSTDPLWKNPDEPTAQGTDMPHLQGQPNQEANTLHNARRARYEARTVR
jgi:hypothetical protein